MNKPFDINDIRVVHCCGTSSLVPVEYRTVIPQEYDTPVLVIEEESDRVYIDIRAGSRDYYDQIVEQIFSKLSRGVKGVSYNEWNSSLLRGRMIIDY